MVPDKFNMVDMEGIDLIESQGLAVAGLYQKLVDSTAQCRYQCLYNWKFDGIIIPPSYVEMEIRDGVVWINEGVSVDEEDVIHIYSIEPEPPAPVEPTIEPLQVTENGVYTAPEGVDGYSPIEVSVAGESPFLTPDYQGLSHSYLATTGDFYNSNEGNRFFINCFHLSANKNYAIFTGQVTSDRNRCAFFSGKSIADFIQYIKAGSSAPTLIYSPSNAISSGDPDVAIRFVFTPNSDGELITITSRVSAQAIGYCIEI